MGHCSHKRFIGPPAASKPLGALRHGSTWRSPFGCLPWVIHSKILHHDPINEQAGSCCLISTVKGCKRSVIENGTLLTIQGMIAAHCWTGSDRTPMPCEGLPGSEQKVEPFLLSLSYWNCHVTKHGNTLRAYIHATFCTSNCCGSHISFGSIVVGYALALHNP